MTGPPAISVFRRQTGSAAVHASFAASGILVASWASRLPQIQEELSLTAAALGLLIVAVGVGTLTAMPLAGHLVRRLGTALSVQAGGIGASVGVAIVGIGTRVSAGFVALGLLTFGFCTAFWNVAQNVEAATIERDTRRPVMSRFHAVFSLGTVAGALGGAAANSLGVSTTAHLCGIAAGAALSCLVAGRYFAAGDPRAARERGPGSVRRAWHERRTLGIGLFALAVAFSQGVGMDWIAVTASHYSNTSPAMASMAYAAFVSGMATTRWFGPNLLVRFGRSPTIYTSLAIGILGVLVFVCLPGPFGFVIGSFAWGSGIALGYPVAMSAAADSSSMAAPRISVVASLTVVAFLGGPALVGGIAGTTSQTASLLLVPLALVLALPLTRSLRPEHPT